MKLSSSVIISFYKNLKFLELVLAGFERQSAKNFEIIIADDGSPEEVVKEVERIISRTSFPILHIWHPDKGFRKNKILNKAIMSARAGYIIFIDGDCIPHSKFVEGHVSSAKRNAALAGRRVNLSGKLSTSLTPEKVSAGWLEKNFGKLVIDGIFGKSFDVEKGFYTENERIRKFFNRKKRGILGCNFSLHKEDLLRVNGFDERYEVASVGEDSDIQYRLELIGADIVSINHIAIQYHLNHKVQPRLQKNLDLFEQVKKEAVAFTPYGIERRAEIKRSP
ncbi:MAG: glycosyltransferase [Ignavibacteriales bacterium]|nr:MAG: glycosyltransferase [Ignavibacteriaceae bacterium]MBW7872599.1 glycosyltransferase [Ignavibacteria bacterium]MCZ2141848.1 glycosyltransferase [Ignavibacteriales bacterium]OQY69720.1 MAG: Chondroitin polymerase [Ignavibacteriales bacterium UTCHB3]MBV6445015.1 Chondroitin synthase [Ignavibacteriaceae bacterium]